ncbi:hypothetical protein ACHAWF_016830, partial [Thalassiosira exigua]
GSDVTDDVPYDEARGGGGGGGIRNRPFASNPLLGRGDSLVERQESLMSLVASETMEGCDDGNILNTSSRSKGSGKVMNGWRKSASSGALLLRTPPPATRRQRSGGSPRGPPAMPTPHASPALELSEARRLANTAQMSNARAHSRETLRNHRDLPPSSPCGLRKDLPSPLGNRRSGLSTRSNSLVSQTPKAGRGPTGSSRSNGTTAPPSPARGVQVDVNRMMKAHLESARPPPLWPDSAAVNDELTSMYQYPRLCPRDPAQILAEHSGVNGGDCEVRGFRWFCLMQRMQTTLKHVQEDRWRAMLAEQQSRHCSNSCGSDSVSAATSSSTLIAPPFSCNGLADHATSNGCRAMQDMCLGNQSEHIEQTNETKSKLHRKSKSWSSGRKVTEAANSRLEFSSSACPVNAWSEPSAATIKVRGPSYSTDGIKVESENSIFAVLGVDSFATGDADACGPAVEGGNDGAMDSPSWGTENFLRRWRRGSKEAGLDGSPFLLVINFIVPWGNFQVYFIRPDADDWGAFSSQRKSQPSEKAWRKFMEGNTEYRNQRLKMIPRICAGPWVVKKMVGSTPALVGTKLPVSYRGSIDENYLEIILDVTKGEPIFFTSTVALTTIVMITSN